MNIHPAKITNEIRAERAATAVFVYSQQPGADNDTGTAFRDLLSDMMHMAKRDGIDFDHELSMAADAFGDEGGAA